MGLYVTTNLLICSSIQDADGKMPLHIAIENQHHTIISLLLSHPALNLTVRDKTGATPFAAAMTIKNIRAARAILDREPTAAEQVCIDGKHIAVWICISWQCYV